MDKKIASLLSLSMKAGKLAAGEFVAEKVIQDKTGKLVIIANDASDNTKKKFINKAQYYKTPVLLYGTGEEIGSYVGKRHRMVIVITDDGFAKKIEELIKSDLLVQNDEHNNGRL